ncbi:MAG: glycosyltransferase family 4 protein [Halothiobacillaceae bacterium]
MNRLDFWIRIFARKVADHGLVGALRLAWQRLLGRRNTQTPTTLPTPDDVTAYYGRILDLDPPPPPAPLPVEKDTIGWLIPPFLPGSGGHTTIFRLIAMLERRGYRHRIHLTEPGQFTSPEQVKKTIDRHFFPLQAEVVFPTTSYPPYEFFFATSWDSAYRVAHSPAQHKLYFVQDYEPWFYPVGSHYHFAERTYRLGLKGITAGDWLASLLHERYGMDTCAFPFSCDKDIYHPEATERERRRVFFYARNVTPRRGFELGLLALERLHRRHPDVEFILAGWPCERYRLPFPYRDIGVVPPRELAWWIARCDAALVLSLSNLSLMPLEIMACGCPLVCNGGPNNEWLLRHEENALLAEPEPQALATALARLLEDPELRERLIANGLACAAATDWEQAGEAVASALERLRAGQPLSLRP